MPNKDPMNPHFRMIHDPRGGFCVTATLAGKENTFSAEANAPEGWTICEAGAQVAEMLEALKQVTGITYDINNRLSVARDALERNHDSDLTVAQMLKDLNEGKGELVNPTPIPPKTRPEVWDTFKGLQDNEHKTMLDDDGEPQQMLSARGALAAAVITWKDCPQNKICERAVKRFTERAAARGAGKSAGAIYADMERIAA